MLQEIFQQMSAKGIFLWNKCVVVLSALLGFIGTSIGYPKQILTCIFFFIVIDIITKHYSIVIINYGKFGIKTYIKAWRERKLTSRSFKNGIGIKALLYLPVLFIAHQASIIPELVFGSAISNFIYSMLFIIEARSILENFEDCGLNLFSFALKFLNSQEKKLLNESNDESSEKSDDKPTI